MGPLSGFSTTLDSGASLANARWVRERWYKSTIKYP